MFDKNYNNTITNSILAFILYFTQNPNLVQKKSEKQVFPVLFHVTQPSSFKFRWCLLKHGDEFSVHCLAPILFYVFTLTGKRVDEMQVLDTDWLPFAATKKNVTSPALKHRQTNFLF